MVEQSFLFDIEVVETQNNCRNSGIIHNAVELFFHCGLVPSAGNFVLNKSPSSMG